MASSTDAGTFRPPLPRGAVPRPRLVRRLDQVSAAGVGLIVASAGSGKSVLLQQWVHGRPDLRIAWLSLTSRHDDSVVFARDLVSAIEASAPGLDASIVQLVKSGGAALGAPFIDAFRAELEAVADGLVIVLEDLHTLTNADLVEDLGTLITSLPSTSRVIVTTRRDLPWNLRQLRLDRPPRRAAWRRPRLRSRRSPRTGHRGIATRAHRRPGRHAGGPHRRMGRRPAARRHHLAERDRRRRVHRVVRRHRPTDR